MNNFEAASFVKMLADMRKMYNDMVDISENERYPQEQRDEAEMMTEQGFISYLAKMMRLSTGKVVEDEKDDGDSDIY